MDEASNKKKLSKRIKNIKGQRFGRLVVLSIHEITEYGAVRWLCKCDCGKEKIIFKSNLDSGDSTSCGCYLKEVVSTHGMSGTRIYSIWSDMKKRCYYKKYSQYKDYGGRGIAICDQWKDFEKFYNWSMQNGYKDYLSIDRIDNNKNYSPDNCRWATRTMQNNNTRKNVFITIDGITLTVSQWARKSGVNTRTLASRYERGITGRELLAKPYKTKRKGRDVS